MLESARDMCEGAPQYELEVQLKVRGLATLELRYYIVVLLVHGNMSLVPHQSHYNGCDTRHGLQGAGIPGIPKPAHPLCCPNEIHDALPVLLRRQLVHQRLVLRVNDVLQHREDVAAQVPMVEI